MPGFELDRDDDDGASGTRPTSSVNRLDGTTTEDVRDDIGVEPGAPLSRRTPFYRGFFWTLGALAAVLLALAVQQAETAIVLIVVAAFLAIGLEPVVGFVGRRGIGRPWAVLIIGLLFVAVIGTVVYVLGNLLADQLTRLVDDAPKLVAELRRNRTVRSLDHKYHFLSGVQAKLSDSKLGQKALTGALGSGVSVFNTVADVVIVYVLMLYFLSAAPNLKQGLYSLAPATRRERVGALGDEILLRVGRYAIGALLVALLAGTVTAILCVSVGLGEYALPLGVLVALLDLVPLVGAIIGAASVCLVGFATSLPVGITCVIFYVVYEMLEGYVIYPRVMRSSVDVPEYVTIVAVLIGGAVGGIVGALLALPVAAAALLLTREVWVRRQDVS